MLTCLLTGTPLMCHQQCLASLAKLAHLQNGCLSGMAAFVFRGGQGEK